MGIALDPFPHLVVDNALADEDLARLSKAWPRRDDMFHDTGHDRWYFDTLRDGVPAAIAGVMNGPVTALIERIAGQLEPFYAARYNSPIRLRPVIRQLHEAGKGFVEHKAHTHYVHNPEYAMTILVYLDDDGGAARGTTLYRHPLGDPLTGALDAASGAMAHTRSVGATIPFRANTALAFVDSPFSLHGSTPFATRRFPWLGRRAQRRMIVVHVGTEPACFADREPVPYETFDGAMQTWITERDVSRLPGPVIGWFERETAVLQSWHHAAS